MFLGCFFSSLLHATIADLFEPVSRASKLFAVRIWESASKAGTNHRWVLFVCLKQQLTCRLFDSEEEFGNFVWMENYVRTGTRAIVRDADYHSKPTLHYHMPPYLLSRCVTVSVAFSYSLIFIFPRGLDPFLGVFTGFLAYYLHENHPRTALQPEEKLSELLRWKYNKYQQKRREVAVWTAHSSVLLFLNHSCRSKSCNIFMTPSNVSLSACIPPWLSILDKARPTTTLLRPDSKPLCDSCLQKIVAIWDTYRAYRVCWCSERALPNKGVNWMAGEGSGRSKWFWSDSLFWMREAVSGKLAWN